MTRAALGLRTHSGWAALVAVTVSRAQLEIVERRRVELGDPAVAGPKQPYHEAEGRPLAEARRIVGAYAREARSRAEDALRSVIGDLHLRGVEVSDCALLTASGRPLPDLKRILASHALIHSADGELFREALLEAALSQRLRTTRIAEKTLLSEASDALGTPPGQLQRAVAEAGKTLGPPWTQDQKLAALAAWLCLSGPSGPKRSAAPETRQSARRR
jgi:hypothetical protein